MLVSICIFFNRTLLAYNRKAIGFVYNPMVMSFFTKSLMFSLEHDVVYCICV